MHGFSKLTKVKLNCFKKEIIPAYMYTGCVFLEHWSRAFTNSNPKIFKRNETI